jgi:putative DNA primase/helicase
MNDLTKVDTNDATPIISPQEITDLRLALHGAGYHPVPVIGAHVDTPSAGKKPTMPAWQTKCLTADPKEIEKWSRSQRNCTNTGILCGEIVGVDIDVLDEDLSAKLAASALQLFGPTSLRRIGRAPKTLLVYRVETPHEKQSTPDLILGDNPEDKNAKAKVEILAQGQQFVGFGTHPDTKAPYSWPEKSPLDVPFADIPIVTLDLIKQFVAEAEKVLRAAGGRTAKEIKEGTKQQEKKTKEREEETKERERKGNKAANVEKNEKSSREKIADALDHIPNDLGYEDWIKIGFALYDGLGEGGRDLWEKWSATYTGNDPKVTATKWPTFAKGRSVKIATLFWYATQQGWWWGKGDASDESDVDRLNKIHAILPIGGKTRVVTFGELPDFPGRETIVMTQSTGDFQSLQSKYRHGYIDKKGELQSQPMGSHWDQQPEAPAV